MHTKRKIVTIESIVCPLTYSTLENSKTPTGRGQYSRLL